MKYNLTFQFFDTQEQAQAFCDSENSFGTAYKRKRKTAHFTPWTSMDKIEHKFIVWYYN